MPEAGHKAGGEGASAKSITLSARTVSSSMVWWMPKLP